MKSEDYYNRISNMVRAYCALAEVRLHGARRCICIE